MKPRSNTARDNASTEVEHVYSTPLYVNADSTDQTGSGAFFYFGKADDEWGLWLRRGKFERSGGGWKYVHGTESRLFPLIEGSREERAAAVAQLPLLIERLKVMAQERLDSFEAAKKAAKVAW